MPSISEDQANKALGSTLWTPLPQFPLNTFDIPEILAHFCGFQHYI